MVKHSYLVRCLSRMHHDFLARNGYLTLMEWGLDRNICRGSAHVSEPSMSNWNDSSHSNLDLFYSTQ